MYVTVIVSPNNKIEFCREHLPPGTHFATISVDGEPTTKAAVCKIAERLSLSLFGAMHVLPDGEPDYWPETGDA